MLGCAAERLCIHLYQMTPTVSHCYSHVNMAKAGGVTALLLLYLCGRETKRISVEQKKKIKKRSSRALRDNVLAVIKTRRPLGSECIETAAQQRGMYDSGVVRIKYSLHSRPNIH